MRQPPPQLVLAAVAVVVACSSPRPPANSLDAGPIAESRVRSASPHPRANSLDAGSNAESGARNTECALSDGGGGPQCCPYYDETRAFARLHDSCSDDSDCAIVGGPCSGSSTVSVGRSFLSEAEELWKQAGINCGIDYPEPDLLASLCEHGRCRTRACGLCGPVPIGDAGYDRRSCF